MSNLVEAMSHGDAFVGMDDGLEDINEKKRQQNMETLVQKGPLSIIIILKFILTNYQGQIRSEHF